ncbi:unnamed protein product, partial [Larinioides sclopetarius]
MMENIMRKIMSTEKDIIPLMFNCVSTKNKRLHETTNNSILLLINTFVSAGEKYDGQFTLEIFGSYSTVTLNA